MIIITIHLMKPYIELNIFFFSCSFSLFTTKSNLHHFIIMSAHCTHSSDHFTHIFSMTNLCNEPTAIIIYYYMIKMRKNSFFFFHFFAIFFTRLSFNINKMKRHNIELWTLDHSLVVDHWLLDKKFSVFEFSYTKCSLHSVVITHGTWTMCWMSESMMIVPHNCMMHDL